MNRLNKFSNLEVERFSISLIKNPSISGIYQIDDDSCDKVKAFDLTKICNVLLKVGAATSIVLGTCNVDFNSTNHSYTETIIHQNNNYFNLNSIAGSFPLEPDKTEDEEFAIAITFGESFSVMPPQNTFEVEIESIEITKGLPSRI